MLNELEEEFLQSQSMFDSDISDIIWGHLKPIFPLLSEVSLSVLVIPPTPENSVYSV